MFNQAEIEIEGRTAVVLEDEKEGGITLRIPPTLHLANSVIALDGTPVHEMWKNRLGRSLVEEQALNSEEREEYITEILGYNIYLTATSMNPYSSGRHVNERQMFTLLEYVYDKHGGPGKRSGEKVPLITSKQARAKLRDYAERTYEEFVKNDELYFNKVRSHSELEHEEQLVVGGSKHPGDREIQRLAALDGYDIPEGEGKGTEKTYGPDGDVYYEHVSHNEVAQAIFRVARSENATGADIYVHTSTVPEWLPVKERVDDPIRVRTDEEHLTIKALQRIEFGHTSEIAEMVDHGERTVRKHLNNLAAEGYVEKEADGRATMWVDADLEDANWWGEVPLDD